MRRIAAVFLMVVLFPSVLAAQGWEWQNPRPHGQDINDMVMIDEVHGVAVCDNGFYLYTADAGQTWSTWRLGLANLERILIASDGALIVVSDRRRIYRSTDMAYSWELVYQGFDNAGGMGSDMAMVDDDTFIGFLNGVHVVISEDAGRTWTQRTNLSFLSEILRSVSVQSPTTWYIATSRNVIKTENRGKDWFYVNDVYDYRGLQRFVFVDSLYGFQLRDGQLLRTTDGTATWEEMDIFGFDLVLDVEVGPHLDDNIFSLSSGRYLVNKSPDGGTTWNISLTESAFADASANTITFVNPELGFVCGQGSRILRTVDGGQSWSIVHGIGYVGRIWDMDFRTADIGMAPSASSTLLITSNGGRRWDEVIPSPDHSLRFGDISPGGAYFLIGLNQENKFDLFRSDDDGLTWRHVSRLPLEYSSMRPEIAASLYARSNDELYVGATYSLLLHSTDGGETWDRNVVGGGLQNPYSTGTNIFFFDPATIIYQLSNSLEVSTDGGVTWESRSAGAGGYMRELQFVSADVGFCLLPRFLARTTDGGRNWQAMPPLYEPSLLHFFDELNGVALWTNANEDNLAYLLRTQDGGETWDRYSMNDRVGWSDWYWYSPDIAWAYGYGGLIRHTRNGGLVNVDSQEALFDGFRLEPGYPNPYSQQRHDAITIPFSLPRPSQVRLTLYDMLGRLAATVDRGTLDPGSHSISIDRSVLITLSPGQYLYRLTAGSESRSGRVVVR